MKIVSVIPIKLNNERLPNKNTKKLGGQPLIKYIQNTLSTIDVINEKYVFCSDPIIKNYLLNEFVFLKRSKTLDLPNSNFKQIFQEFKYMVDADIYVYAHATAPFLNEDTIKDCIAKVQSGKYDSAFTATKIQDFLWKNNSPLNFESNSIPRSQDLEPIYRETSGVYVFNKETYEKYERRIGINPYIKLVSFKESIDINENDDFELAKALLEVEI